ncbi:MAG: IMP dehydrogenase [Spirochaetota bacterium]
MAVFYNEPSRTFNEFLLIPNLTAKSCVPANVRLTAPLVKFKKGTESSLHLNIPFVSSIMQSVSNDAMAIALARAGGLSFIYCSQSIEEEVAMVGRVKKYKAGFVVSDSNVRADATLADVLSLKEVTGHSTVAVTDDGTPNGKLIGIVGSKDYRADRMKPSTPVSSFMTPFTDLVYGKEGISLSEANDLIWDHKLNALPIIDKGQKLIYIVFRKDYNAHEENPNELLDPQKRLVVGAGINTRDFSERIPALVEAGADVFCLDSSDGYSEWQKDTIDFVRKKYGDAVKIGAGNVVDREGFLYLVENGADFVKVGIGGGSICITREQKGIGRGQATSIMEVAKARDEHFAKSGVYVPICSDGGLVYDYHIVLALAMGADFVMMGRYFARFDESPTRKLQVNGTYVKEYWGEGSNRARNWQRYDMGGKNRLAFEEGVDSYVPYAGKLKDNVDITLSKVRSTMCNCGATSIAELQKTARLTLVSSTSIVEGGAHDVIPKEQNVDVDD